MCGVMLSLGSVTLVNFLLFSWAASTHELYCLPCTLIRHGNRAFSKTLFKAEEFDNACFSFSVLSENYWATIITWFPRSETNSKWPLIVTFLSSSRGRKTFDAFLDWNFGLQIPRCVDEASSQWKLRLCDAKKQVTSYALAGFKFCFFTKSHARGWNPFVHDW